MQKKIAVIPGDGIGPEVIAQAIKVLKAIERKYHHEFELNEYLIGAAAMDQKLPPLPKETLESCRRADAVLFGAIGSPRYDSDPHAILRPEHGLIQLRKELELYANYRPIKSYRKLYNLSPLKEDFVQNIDLIIFRELTGGLYFGNKSKDPDGFWASDECHYEKDEIIRVAKVAFDESRIRRKQVTLVDKANLLESSRLWRSVVQELQKSTYPDVELNFLYVDQAAMQLVLNPAQFDIILAENMMGDILCDEASVIVGSIGLLPSGSYGESLALFEPVHGSYPQAAGRNIANPLAIILAVALMLDYFGLIEESESIESAVNFVINEGLGTVDLATRTMISCSEMGDLISELVADTKSNWPEVRKNVMPLV